MAVATDTRSGKVRLDMPVNYLKGVGPARAELLRRLGIVTARDLLYHIPHRYEDASTISPIASLEPGMDGTIIGKVISLRTAVLALTFTFAVLARQCTVTLSPRRTVPPSTTSA